MKDEIEGNGARKAREQAMTHVLLLRFVEGSHGDAANAVTSRFLVGVERIGLSACYVCVSRRYGLNRVHVYRYFIGCHITWRFDDLFGKS